MFGKKTGAWIGKTITVDYDATVLFAGKPRGGMRIQVPRRSRKPHPSPVEAEDDAIGF